MIYCRIMMLSGGDVALRPWMSCSPRSSGSREHPLEKDQRSDDACFLSESRIVTESAKTCRSGSEALSFGAMHFADA
jgi:hypothetical protein